jgi:hypothetical protein
LYVLIVKQREAESAIHQNHCSTLSGEDVRRQLKSAMLQAVICVE